MKIRTTIFKSVVFGAFAFSILFVIGCAGKGEAYSDKQLITERSPKNVIIMISDGCGFNHIKATDYYQCGRTPCQSYEEFPVQLAMSTYPAGGRYDANLIWARFDYAKNGCTDSAASATAMATGVKTKNGRINLDTKGNILPNLVERAEQLGKATGVITSVPFSHATPAGFVAHNISRNNYTQLADEMVNQSAIDVIMGCGHPCYDDNGKPTQTCNYKYIDESLWNNLKAGSIGADADGDGTADAWTLIQNRDEFQQFTTGPTPKRLFAIAQAFATLQQSRNGDVDSPPFKVPLIETVPTLEEMTKAALNVLDNDPDGFFIMIEGGAVDWAGHNNQSGRLIEEMLDFNNSVDAVIEWVKKNSNWGETLVIVTADHETGYITGPGSGQFPAGPLWNELVNNGAGKLPGMLWNSGDHTNSLVPFFAKGRGAKLFKDTTDGEDPVRGPYIDNTDIANVIFALWNAD